MMNKYENVDSENTLIHKGLHVRLTYDNTYNWVDLETYGDDSEGDMKS